MTKKRNGIGADVLASYPMEKLRAIEETILEYTLQIEYLTTPEGRAAAASISGEVQVDASIEKLKIVLAERTVERDFIREKFSIR